MAGEQTIEFEGTQHVFPADFSQQDIQKALSTVPPPRPSIPPPALMSGQGMQESSAPKVADWGLSALPAAGGAIGGILGAGAGVATGPGAPAASPYGAVAGAALGGAAGRGAETALRRQIFPETPNLPSTIGENVKDMALQGALPQAVAEGAGQALAGGAKAVAENPAVQRWMARPLNRMLRPSLDAFEYGNNPGMALMKAEPPTLTGKYGMRDFINKTIDSTATTRDAAAQQLAQRGVTVDAQTPIRTVVNKAIANPTKYEEDSLVKTLGDIEERLTTQQGVGQVAGPNGQLLPVRVPRGYDQMPVDEAIKFRQYLDDAIGEFDPATTSRVKSTLQSIRGSVNEAIHGAAPQLKEADSQLQGLIAGRQAISTRIAHLESGTRETSAGKGMLGQIASHLHVPGSQTVPGAVAISKARQVLGFPGSTALGRGALRQIPRAATIPPPPSDESDQPQQ